MMNFLPMETGFIIRIMVLFGSPESIINFILMAAMGIGFIHMKDGHGFHCIRGDGHRFTMDAGFMIRFIDGFGFQDISGDALGFHGDSMKDIMDGRP